MAVLVLDQREEIIVKIHRDRYLGHQALFSSRHKNQTPYFHREIVEHLHCRRPNICDIAFRGSAKSTLAEEAVALMACLRDFRHCLVTGASFDKAAERLHAIRRQFESNENLIELFGSLKGRPWGDDRLELSTGITIQAMGRGQALRGTKNEDSRPDYILCDDIEDKISMATAEGAEKIQSWFFTELLPAGDEPNLRVRVLCNDMGVNCLGNRLAVPGSGFEVNRYPWVYKDATGHDAAIWPDRFPLEKIELKRRQMVALGRITEYNMEYLCRSETPEEKPFKRDMIRIEPQVRTWQAVYAVFDPARTVKEGSCDTGFAAWSWIANRLVVWDAWGKKLLPDEIIASMFECHETFHPVHIGVDEVGLNEFMLQPIRQESVRRGVTLSIKPMPARKSKIERIRALQPFANSRELIFAQPLAKLEAQLLAFPYGMRDVADALAYAPIMRPGAPVYEDFTGANVMERLAVPSGSGAWLCLNASPMMTVAVLVYLVDGNIRVVADWVREGEPSGVLSAMMQEARLVAEREVRPVIPPEQFDRYNNAGLVQATRKLSQDIRTGTSAVRGRGEVRTHLRRLSRGLPALLVSTEAGWTLNAFAAGYCYGFNRATGQLSDQPEEGPYRLLMEALESFAGLLAAGSPDEESHGRNYAYTKDGRRYTTARKEG